MAGISSPTNPLVPEFKFNNIVIKQEVIEELPTSIKEPLDVRFKLEEVFYLYDGE